MSSEPCLVLDDVSKQFGGLHAVEGVSLSVAVGERRAIIGANGAGKTTLFNLICGELPISAGKISLFGTDITLLPAHRRVALGISRTFQITNLFPELTVRENLLLAAQGTRREKFVMYKPMTLYRQLYDAADQFLEEFGLSEDRDTPVKNLSHGDQRQIEVCLALIGRPRLLLLDEPTAGLSPAETAAFTEILKLIDQDITVLLIEHDMSVAFALAQNITVLHLGKLVTTGGIDDVRGNKEVQDIYFGTE